MSTRDKANFDKELVHQVDKLVMNTGCFQAVEFLLQVELLPYAEYEQWRMGHILYLSEVLTEQREVILPLLDEAGRYVSSLNMLPEPLLIQQWEQNNQLSHLKLCPEKSAFSKYLNEQYIRQDNEQMDLFFDNRSLIIVSELKRALISRNIQTASQKLQSLYEIEPDHDIIKPTKKLLDSLVNALEEDQITDIIHEMHFLIKELAPLAKETLSGQERDYMSLFWRRLARYINDSIYCEQQEKFSENKLENVHSSFCFEQIPDWQAVIKSIEQESVLIKSPRLFARYCLALRRSGQYEQYIQNTCQFFWQFSNKKSAQIAQGFLMVDPILNNLWHDFHDLEFDTQWGRCQFPCLLLIKIPGICHYVKADNHSPEEFGVLLKLIKTEMKDGNQSISLRKQLKESHANIFQYFLEQKK